MNFKKTFTFLKALRDNNNKEWFDAHRKDYVLIRKEVVDFCAHLIAGISSFDPSVKGLEPSACIFRINRDVRFSVNKDPYKTHIGIYLNKGGKKSNTAGYYFHLEPDASFVAAGIYAPGSVELAAIRQEIDYHLPHFLSILKKPQFIKEFNTLQGEKLMRPPKGYDAGNEAVEYLKYKSYIVTKHLNNKYLYEGDVPQEVVRLFRLTHPLVDFLNTALA